jgi:FtsH-binding integral membrane protein
MLQSAGNAMMWGVLILQFGTLFAFRPMSQRMGAAGTRMLFFFYAAITGWTVGVAALVFTMASLLNVFFMAALAFGGLAMFGHVTKKNLGVVGTFCLQALWMTFFFGIFYMFAQWIPAVGPYLPSMNITLGLLGILVFSGITAYEAQKLREVGYSLAKSDAGDMAISQYTSFGALNMYLNFINLFFSLLRIMGKRR